MKKARVLLPALVLVLMLSMLCGCADKGEASNGSKITFTLTVTHSDSTQKEFKIETSQTNLRRALEDEKLISGTESTYGLYVTTVDGETADYDANQSWWNLVKNGEASPVGIDSCTVEDGDNYGFIYTIGS